MSVSFVPQNMPMPVLLKSHMEVMFKHDKDMDVFVNLAVSYTVPMAKNQIGYSVENFINSEILSCFVR